MSMPIETIIDSQKAAPAGGSAPTGEEQILNDSGFFWRERGGVKLLICRELEAAGFANGFSTRIGGVSPFPAGSLNLAGFDDDAAENIYENRRRFLTLFDGNFELALAWQVHGDEIRIVSGAEDIGDSELRSDGVMSDIRGVLAGVKTADCVPVLIGDPVTRAFVAIHAGWRGTAQAIAAKAVGELTRIYRARASDLIAAIGPAASCRHYEIGRDVIDDFRNRFGDASAKYFTATRDGHALVDLHSANRDQLLDAGIARSNIFTAPFCTMERADLFFSYRREKQDFGKTGRLLSVIGRIEH